MQTDSNIGIVDSENNLRLLGSSFYEAQKPDPVMTVSDWADKYRFLSAIGSAEPGRYRTSRTPYLKEPMDHLSATSLTQEVVVMKGSQVGFSEAALCWMGYVMERMPGPSMIVQPTDGLAKRFSKQRLDPMIRETPALMKKVREKKSRDSSNTATMKEFDAGVLVISGANSAVNLRSMPIKNLLLDEVDGYPVDIDGEGDPVELAEVRTRTFPRRKIFKGSSPTRELTSRIHKAYEETDKRRFYVPCPHCEEFQVIEWSRIKWKSGKPETAKFECIKCKKLIEEHHKTVMLARGQWRPTGTAKKPRVVGYHLSALYSPLGWYSWTEAARDFLKAKENPNKLMVFVNTVLGEVWKEKGEAPDWQALYDRREQYPMGTVPKGGTIVTVGVDVQKTRFELEIVAWGENKESWSIDYRVEECDTSDSNSYEVLDKLLAETFPVEGSTVRLPVRMMAIDSGFNTQIVYDFCRKRKLNTVAVKGFDNQPSLLALPKPMDVSYAGRKIRNGVMLWKVGTNIAKTELYGWLGLKKPKEDEEKPEGWTHFPQYGEEYFKMLTAEHMVLKPIRGFRRYIWEQTGRNEALDARIYARIAACIVGLDRFTDVDWKEMKDAIYSKKAEKAGAVKTKDGIPVRNSEFWG